MKKWMIVVAMIWLVGMNEPATANAQSYEDDVLFLLYTVRMDTVVNGRVSDYEDDDRWFQNKWDALTIQIGTKTYKARLKQPHGEFSLVIGKHPEGTVLRVHLTSDSGKKSKVRTIKLGYENYYEIRANNLFVNSTTVKGSYTGYMKGDTLTVSSGKKSYKGVFSNKGKFTVKIPKQKAGTKLLFTLRNRKGQILEQATSKVYTTSRVKIGMTKKQVLATSWGEPHKKSKTISKYGNYEQWVYEWDDYSVDTLFLKNGKVVSIDSY